MRTTFKHGDWLAQCDRCDEKFHASDLRKTWDNLYVCKLDWEPRHPMDFLKGFKDDTSVPWTRPSRPDTEIDTSAWAPQISTVPDGNNDNSL